MSVRHVLPILATLFVGATANAAFIEIDLHSDGDALVTFDSASGLEWLDLSLTNGLSYSAIMSDEGGWISDGWRYASETDIVDMWAALGLTNRIGDYDDFGELEATLRFFDLFGMTQEDPRLQYQSSHAITGITLDDGTRVSAAVGRMGETETIAWTRNIAIGDFGSGDGISSFLVRERITSVPEPTTFGLMLLALGAMATARRSR